MVDDHGVVRRGLMEIISASGRTCEFVEAETLAQALDALENHTFDLAVVDISLPDGNGLDLVSRASRTRPEMPVVVLSMHQEAEYARRALALGARGYLGKNFAPEELGQAIARVLGGQTYVSEALSPGLLAPTGRAALSRREREVAHRLAQGEKLSDVAQAMGISVKTASTYRTRAMRKLGLTTTADFFRYMLGREIL